jgi:hypothetical protein
MPSPTNAIPGMPSPPPPGAPTAQYGYPNLGPQGHQFATIPDADSASSGRGEITSGELPITVSYVNETRWFNVFRAERRPQADVTKERVTPTGHTRVRSDGGMCWNEQEVVVTTIVEQAYDELQRYEVWRINTTLEGYYEFFTGFGGTTVDFAVDGSALAAEGVSQALGSAAAETAGLVGAGAGGDLGAAMATASLRNAATVTGAAARALGLAGWGYLVFQVTTGAMVWFQGGSRNAAGDKLSEGWETLRRFYEDPIETDERTEWRAVDEPHPCSGAEEARLRNEDAIGLPAPRRVRSDDDAGSRRRTALLVTLATGGALVVLVLLLLALRDGDQDGEVDAADVPATTVAAPVTTAAPTTVALVPSTTDAVACVVDVTLELVGIDAVPGQYHQGNIAVHVLDAGGQVRPDATVAVQTDKSDGTSTTAEGVTSADGVVVFGMRTTAYGTNTLEVRDVRAPGCTWEQSTPAALTWEAQP